MPTRNVVLTGRQEALIERREADDAAKLEALREAARIGIEALDHGDFTEFADVDELMAYLDASTDATLRDQITPAASSAAKSSSLSPSNPP